MAMRTFWTTMFAALILAAGAIVNAGAAPLRVGLNPEYPPLVFRKDGQLTGIEPTMANEVGALLAREIEFVELPFERLLPALAAGEIDVIMSGMSITPERSEQVAFTDSYLEIGQMAIIRAADMVPFALPRALNKPGARVGVESNTTGAAHVRESLPAAQVTEFLSPDQAFAALLDKRIDFFVHDAPTSWNLAQQPNSPLMSLFKPLTSEQLAWAVRKDDLALLAALNDALQQLVNNGRLKAIQGYYIPIKVQVGE